MCTPSFRTNFVDRFDKENFPKILELVDGLAEIGKRHNATAGQVALAWLLAQGKDIIPIPGTRKVKVCATHSQNYFVISSIELTALLEQYLRENQAAINVKLSDEEIAHVRKLAESSDLGGFDRYPSAMMGTLFGDTPSL